MSGTTRRRPDRLHGQLSLPSKQGIWEAHHRILGWGALYLGEFSVSQTHIDEALRLYDPEQHGGLKLRYAHDTRVAALCVRAILQCICGHLDQASTTTKAAVDYARSIDHAPSLAYALVSSTRYVRIM